MIQLNLHFLYQKFDNLKVSPLATITMPYHIEVDGWSEANSGKGKIGTTKRGIGPTYTDKMARIAFKIQDLYSLDALNRYDFTYKK